MANTTTVEILIKQIDQYALLTKQDTNDKIRNAIQGLLDLWPQVVAAGDKANPDELFDLNISRTALYEVFQILLSKQFFYHDQSLIRKVFFTCFTILVDHADIFQNKNSKYILSNVRLMLQMASYIVSLVQYTQDDFSTDAEQKLLIAMREYVDQTSTKDSLAQNITSLVWNLVDKTILVPAFLKAGYAKSVIQWIKDHETKSDEELFNASVNILHNLARHDDGSDQLNSYNALEVIDQLEIESNEEGNDLDTMMTIIMTRVLLTDKDQIKFDGTKYPSKVINMLVKFATDAAMSQDFSQSGFHLSEPLVILMKLFCIDEILDNILTNNSTDSSLINLLTSVLGKLYPKITYNKKIMENYTCVVLLNCFWIISNHEKYRSMIRDNEQLIGIIRRAANDEETFQNTFMPRTMKGIKEAANAIIDNLDRRN